MIEFAWRVWRLTQRVIKVVYKLIALIFLLAILGQFINSIFDALQFGSSRVLIVGTLVLAALLLMAVVAHAPRFAKRKPRAARFAIIAFLIGWFLGGSESWKETKAFWDFLGLGQFAPIIQFGAGVLVVGSLIAPSVNYFWFERKVTTSENGSNG